ncbi:MAG: hypothetical protein HYU36_19970 [Planctomycetes bacterium]|nr:hypothetical protein [Planctomycetota bacterium]
MDTASIYYVDDRGLHNALNDRGRNFWYAYVEEIFDQLGIRAASIEPTRQGIEEILARASCLVLGPVTDPALFPTMAPALQEWVARGGILIGFGCEGLDALFGVDGNAMIRQPMGDFALNGFFDVQHVAVAAGVHSYLHPGQRLLIFSDVRAVTPNAATVVGRYGYANGRPSPFAAVTARPIGSGWAFYFAFDVPKTLWVLHQGRPVDADYDGDGYFRASDARVIGHNEEEVLYADEILFLIQNMIARRPQPFIFACPPVEDAPPHMLLFWGGDDEARAGSQVLASDFMAARNLPYHLNIMPEKGEFRLSASEAEHIRSNNHELSLHYNFITGRTHPYAFTQADMAEQAEAFLRAFGRRAECTVNHWVTWVGWAEPAKWMAACGGTADNGRIHSATPPLNPANQIGFSFGSAFPFSFYDDWRNGNARIDFIEEPITAYEMGYRQEENDFAMVHRAMDLAAHYHLTMNLFYHPPNIAYRASCRAAIDEALSYIRRRGLRVKHAGNDELARWWKQRRASWAGDLCCEAGRIQFSTRTEHRDGMIVKIPSQSRTAAACRCSGRHAAFENRFEFGQNWVYVVAPEGECAVSIELSQRDSP